MAISASLAAMTLPATAADPRRTIGDIGVFATLPYPGNPGGMAIEGRTLYVDTSASNFDRPFDGSNDIFAYDLASGRLLPQTPNPIVVANKLPVSPMGLAGIATDASGRLYVADMNGRIDRIDRRTGATDVYATFPTASWTSLTDMPTFLAFTADGNLYAGDAAGPPVIWRIPPGGGSAQPWLVDPRLAGSWAASILGLAVDPTGQYLYFAAGNQAPGLTIYRLPFSHPDAGHLEAFHTYTDVVVSPCPPSVDLNTPACASTPLFGAGNIAFGASGKLYVVLLAKNQISMLNPDGTEANRFPSPQQNMALPVPLNFPFDVSFDGRGSLLVSNTGKPTFGYGPGHTPPPGGLPSSSDWVVFDIYVGDTAIPLAHPAVP